MLILDIPLRYSRDFGLMETVSLLFFGLLLVVLLDRGV